MEDITSISLLCSVCIPRVLQNLFSLMFTEHIQNVSRGIFPKFAMRYISNLFVKYGPE